MWINIYDTEAEKIINEKADDIRVLKDSNNEKLIDDIVKAAFYKEYKMRI